MTQEQIAAILLRRDRSADDIAQIVALITPGTRTTDQARIEEAIARAKAGADGWADCLALLTPP